MDSRYTHIGIDKQSVKDKRIQMKLVNFSFKIFNVDSTKNGEVTRITPLKVEINGHKEYIDVAVIDLNGMNMFLEHNWLVKHNLEVNWKEGKIWFTKFSELCRTKYQDIEFKTRRIQAMETQDKD